MAFFLELFLYILCFLLLFCYYLKKQDPVIPTQWPIVGMAPALAGNMHHFHDISAAILAASGLNFSFRGPALSGMRFFACCEPANVRHIFTSNASNYPKGEDFAEIFDIFDGTILTVDGETWRPQRSKAQHVIHSPQFACFMARSSRAKVEDGVMPFLDRVAARGAAAVDLQDLFARFVFDVITILVFGVDPGYLSENSRATPVVHAMDYIMEAYFMRHVLPVPLWKVMRKLNVGHERRLAAASRITRGFVAEMIAARKAKNLDQGDAPAPAVEVVSFYENDPQYVGSDKADGEFLCAMLINYFLAGRDTMSSALTWLFYSLAQNPQAVHRIRRELEPLAAAASATRSSNPNGIVTFEPGELKGLVYLRAAIFESLRLHPPVSFERKAMLADDVLPSGHLVGPADTVLGLLHAMARMEAVWGEHCREYRPEISKDGKRKFVPSYKFATFSTGPRSCLRKQMAPSVIEAVAAAVLWNFELEAVEGSAAVQPKLCIFLQMKHGFMVRVKRRVITSK